MKWFGHSAIFWPFRRLKKMIPFKAYFEKISANLTIFLEIQKLVQVILTNFHKKIALFSYLWILNIFDSCNPQPWSKIYCCIKFQTGNRWVTLRAGNEAAELSIRVESVPDVAPSVDDLVLLDFVVVVEYDDVNVVQNTNRNFEQVLS